MCRWFFHRRPEISLLIPFGASKDSDRAHILKWLKRYWRAHLPDAEIIVGRDRMSYPFSKTCAVNEAARRARGKFFVILDADAYFDASVITDSIRRIGEAERRGRHLWFIPYRHLYRLTGEATRLVLDSDPRHPYRLPIPPPPHDIENVHPAHYGHHYAAMVMVMSREAFWIAGGMDSRFRGWGSEDAAFMHALDTLYGPHRTIDHSIFHLHHERFGYSWNTTAWAGQEESMPNHKLAMRYYNVRRDKKKMQELVDEFREA